MVSVLSICPILCKKIKGLMLAQFLTFQGPLSKLLLSRYSPVSSLARGSAQDSSDCVCPALSSQNDGSKCSSELRRLSSISSIFSVFVGTS